MVNLVEVTSFGAEAPEFIVAGWSDSEVAIAQARALYLAGSITIEEFEQRVAFALRLPW